MLSNELDTEFVNRFFNRLLAIDLFLRQPISCTLIIKIINNSVDTEYEPVVNVFENREA